jgi:hypothetical protein
MRAIPWALIPWAPQHVCVFSRTNTLSRTALFRPGLSSLGRHSTSACFRAQIRFRVLRAITLGSWAPQHVRVLPRTNTLSRTARLSPWAFIPWAPQHVRVLSRTNTLSRIARNRLGLSSLGPHSTSACFRALIRYRVLRAFRPGLSSLGRHSTSACFRALIRYRVLRSSPWALIPGRHSTSACFRAQIRYRVLRAVHLWALIPQAPQHVRVLSRTNTL